MAIHTEPAKKHAYLINPRGGFVQLDFYYGAGTEILSSCSLQFRNQYYVFGGRFQNKQVSMVNGYRLERKGTLNFDFDAGGCTVLKEETIILCFDWRETKVCRKSNNPVGLFIKLSNSIYSHWVTKIASINGTEDFFENKMVIVTGLRVPPTI